MADSPYPTAAAARTRPTQWRHRSGAISLDQPRLLGIINTTPDSFSDGGHYLEPAAACDATLQMLEAGADALDIGGASTRPGAQPVAAAEQLRRVIPVIERLRQAGIAAPISIDTTLSAVAAAAIAAGADIINDQSAGEEDAAMLDLAARHNCGVILMHRLRAPAEDAWSTDYPVEPEYAAAVDGPGEGSIPPVARHVRNYLEARAQAALQAGISPQAIALDPGLGFGKSVRQNFQLIAHAGHLMASGYPIVSAASRKSFIGRASGVEAPAQRSAGTLAASVWQATQGIRLFRIHDVVAHQQALAVAAAIGQCGP